MARHFWHHAAHLAGLVIAPRSDRRTFVLITGLRTPLKGLTPHTAPVT